MEASSSTTHTHLQRVHRLFTLNYAFLQGVFGGLILHYIRLFAFSGGLLHYADLHSTSRFADCAKPVGCADLPVWPSGHDMAGVVGVGAGVGAGFVSVLAGEVGVAVPGLGVGEGGGRMGGHDGMAGLGVAAVSGGGWGLGSRGFFSVGEAVGGGELAGFKGEGGVAGGRSGWLVCRCLV